MGEQHSYTSIRPVLSRVVINAQPKADKASSTNAISVSFCAVRQDALYGGMHKGRAEMFARKIRVPKYVASAPLGDPRGSQLGSLRRG
jgi:hypothetical protein